MSSPTERRTASPARRRPVSMEERTDRERSPPPDQAESAAAEIPVPNSPTPTGRTFQDKMPASPTGGQGLMQEALIEILRNQHQNIVQQQNLIAGQGAQISELTKLVSGLVQMQTDVLKDQAQREADERERKAEEERKAAEEAATSSTPRAGSLFTSAPKKSDSKYSGSRWRVTYRTVHNLRSKIQEEGMRSTPGYPSENDLDRGCVFWMSATQRNCKRQ